MVHFLFRACSFSMLGLVSLANTAVAQQSAYELLPDSVQAIVWIPDADQLVERWQRTQLSKLAGDPAVRPFFEDQRQAIEDRFIDAGWRLNVTPQDLKEFSKGQVALAWMEKTDAPRKPFALAMLADVGKDAQQNQRLIDTIDGHLALRKPQKKETLQHLGVEIHKYTMPKRADQLLAEDAFYAVTDGQLLATDDEPLMHEIIARVQRQPVAGARVLSQDPVFIAGREKAKISGEAQIEYFVRPLGIARVLRSIGGKRSKSNADILAVLQNQGFSAIQCVCGQISVGQAMGDLQHHGYVLAEKPLPASAGILDFPNAASREIPNFVTKNISSLLATNWNAKEAFWKAEGLVDELAGTEGVFAEVIEGIKKDPNGPRIDIAQDVLPQLTNDIYAISDSKAGETTVDSRRNLIALKVKDSAAMTKVLDRAMRNEPDAESVEFDGHPIWKVVHREDELVVDVDLDNFGEFDSGPANNQNQPEPWLSNWAITVYDGYLMFASHVEMIEEAVTQAKSGFASPLAAEAEYQRVVAAMGECFGEQQPSGWKIVRNSLEYRVQYELFRAGKLKESQSMLASILDRLLQSDSEIKEKVQAVQGSSLPPFETISHFLQPSGLLFRSTDSGWEFGGLLLAAEFKLAAPAEKTPGDTTAGTARASSDSGSNR